jgi:hypothetical protein
MSEITKDSLFKGDIKYELQESRRSRVHILSGTLNKNRVLENLHFPLNKQNLIQQAIKHGASYVVIEELKNIPGKEYTSFSIVVKELGGK